MTTKLNVRPDGTTPLHNNPQHLYDGLKNLTPASISYLHTQTFRYLVKKRLMTRASLEDIQEMTDDAVLITLQKVGNGGYRFRGTNPLVFTQAIATNLLRNFCRKRTHCCQSLDHLDPPDETDVETYWQQKETELFIEKAMNGLDELSRLLIQLKYFDGLRDEEIIERRLTSYTTVDSLKTKRCACMKKLREIVNQQACD